MNMNEIGTKNPPGSYGYAFPMYESAAKNNRDRLLNMGHLPTKFENGRTLRC